MHWDNTGTKGVRSTQQEKRHSQVLTATWDAVTSSYQGLSVDSENGPTRARTPKVQAWLHSGLSGPGFLMSLT